MGVFDFLKGLNEEVSNQKLYQVSVVCMFKHKNGLKKDLIPFEFRSTSIFTSKEDADAYVPFYLQSLVNDSSIPADAVNKKEDGLEINHEMIHTEIKELLITEVQRNDI